MKIRGLIVAALVFLALAGILYWSEHRKPDETAKAATAAPPAILKLDEASSLSLRSKRSRLRRCCFQEWLRGHGESLNRKRSGLIKAAFRAWFLRFHRWIHSGWWMKRPETEALRTRPTSCGGWNHHQGQQVAKSADRG